MSQLHQALLEARFTGHDLEVFMIRLLFCFFADDTGIFGSNGQFTRMVRRSREDGKGIWARSWMRTIAGRLESRYRYSVHIVYNNYPWSLSVPEDRRHAIAHAAAAAVLAARRAHPTSTMADLYDPDAMPDDLRRAHQAVDKAVDSAYGYRGDKIDAAVRVVPATRRRTKKPFALSVARTSPAEPRRRAGSHSSTARLCLGQTMAC